MRAIVSWTAFWLTILTAIAQGQRFEVTGSIGGQVNGSLDLSTVLLQGIDVQNSITRSAGISYEPDRHSAVEFMWNYTSPGVVSQPIAGGLSAKAFNLDMNQYFGNLLFHFVTREPKLRPFILGGLGVSSLSTGQNGVKGTTRLVFALGGGVKYNFARHFGLRLQAKWSPTYLSTTQAGYWCDPGWGGCWATNRNHYLNGLNGSAGLTFRF